MFHASGADVDASMRPALRARGVSKDREILADAGVIMTKYGLRLDPATCVTRPAFVGAFRYHYKFCEVQRMPTLARHAGG